MKMGPRDSYLCLVPKPLDLSPPSDDETDEEITPAAGADPIFNVHKWLSRTTLDIIGDGRFSLVTVTGNISYTNF